jgi:hypothetical protein
VAGAYRPELLARQPDVSRAAGAHISFGAYAWSRSCIPL